MTLQEIFDILNANIQANGGTLMLAPGTISSPEIAAIFDAYLLNEDLVVDEAAPVLNDTSVTVSGKGNSLLFFQTTINTLTFTVAGGVPSMAVNADAIISDEGGWTFGASFPVLEFSNWGGFYDPADKTKWIQHIFFDSANFSLTSGGLKFSGLLQLTGALEPLTFLFNGMNAVEVKGPITLNKGEDGFVADNDTVVPVMKLIGKIGVVEIDLGSLPTFTLQFSMNASAHIIPKGKSKGTPVPVLKLLVETTIPIETITNEVETIGVAAVIGVQSSSLMLRAIMPKTIEVGISEIIALANNENVLAIMPSNMPVLNDFVLKDWSVTFNTETRSISTITFDVGTRAAFNWVIVPGYITLTAIELWITIAYLNGTFSAGLTIGGSIQLGTGDDAAIFNITAAFPGYVFMGALDDETPLDLKPILTYLLGTQIGNSLPDTLKLSTLNISIDPKNSSYSLEMAITTDLLIPVPITPIIITEVAFDINYVAGAGTGSILGNFKLGKGEDVLLFVSAAYGGEEEGWVFSGGLQDGSQIKLGDLIEDYLPAAFQGFNPVDITIDSLLVIITQGQKKSYYFKLGATWKLDLGLTDKLYIKALTEITYDPAATPIYDGYVEGEVIFGNINLKARVDFKDTYNVYTFTFMNKFRAILTTVDGDSMICFDFTDNTSLGDMIALLVSAATGQEITLPSPWNVMNNIRLKDFVFSFNITKNRIGLSYSPSINLGFIDIKTVTLYYTYFPDIPDKDGVVEIAITQGSFLGGAVPLPKPWDVAKPETAPAVPGQGESLFRLEFLGMGQHLSVIDEKKLPDSVAAAVELLKKSFESATPDPNNPIEGTGLEFNSSSNWLIGTQFVIVDTFAIGIVFFDPDLYGLSLYVNGPKAKVFQGLKFEILYKKISDTVGVYQVYLKLPDSIRQLDFGTVSVTLPSVKIYIYTNGDFKIDFGFPVNDDYSESFGLQLLPFIGSGGFYFGLLSAETASTVPAASNGNFSPVIVFGVGLRVGIGKEINKGILKAGISIVVQGILEGTFAKFNYYEDKPANINDPTYFYILGKIAIVGHVYGSVDFLIISAEVDLKVFVAARIVFQSYEPILISLSAGVSVSVKVRINLGLFKITIGMSFSTTIEESFTVGSPQPKPWITNNQYAALFRQPALRALDTESECPVIPGMNWQPIIPTTPVTLDIWYIPQFTAATEGSGEQKARAVAMLYLESSIDTPSLTKMVLRKGVVEEEDYAFTKFAKGAFLWVLGAYFNKANEGVPVDTILNEPITIADLNKIVCYFSQNDFVEPFTIDDVFDFMANYLKATVVIPPRTPDVETETMVSVLPMLPNLIFETPGGDIYFDNANAEYTYDQEQLRLIHRYFNELAVQNKGDAEEKPLQGFAADEEKQSLATFMLIDYISLLAKESCQKGIDRLTALGVTVDDGDSVEDIVNKYPHFGISAVELAYSNRKRALRAGATLSISRLNYTVKHNDTLESVCARFDVGHGEVLRANTYLRQQATNPCVPTGTLRHVEMVSGFGENNTLIPGATIVVPGVKHVTASANGLPENLLSVAKRYGISVLDLIAENTGVPGLFQPSKKILVPFAEGMTVRELIDAMAENGDFEQLSGLSANIMLQGLRVPLPGEGSTIGIPEAMYKVSGQQIDASQLTLDQSLTLKLPEPLEWLGLGAEDGIELPYTLYQEDIDALSDIQGAYLQPAIIDLVPNALFDIQARRFTLPANITWQLPVALTLANGTNELQDTIDPSIWMFQTSLQALLNGYDAIAPKVALRKQVQETKTKTSKPEPIIDYGWSTKIDMRLTQVRSSEDPTQLMPNVYELQGIDQASMTLLKNLVEYYGEHLGTAIIRQIDVLYSKEPAKEGQTSPPSGLKSDSIANTTMYLLQTNLSTLSNPPQSAASARLAAVPGMQDNLLGMSQIEFLKYAWESAIVGTGGYYLYYQIKDSKAGLPEYLFNGDTDNIVTLVITYNITDDILLNFLNSVIVREPINIDDEILYVETLAQTVSNVAPQASETLQSFALRHSTTVSKIAMQNRTAIFSANLPVAIPGAGAANNSYVAGPRETLEAVAEKHGVSIIALAHANRDIAGLFVEPLTFDTRIEVKVATVPPGNIGFSMKRENPLNVNGLDLAEINLQQLYNLLGYNVAGNDDFTASVPGLPVAPGEKTTEEATDLDTVARPSAEVAKDYLYDRIIPVYPFAKTGAEAPVEGDVPPEKENPYRAVGKTARIDMRWQDIFGNLTSFTNTGSWPLPPQKIGYIDPVIGISLYPSISASYIVEKPAGGTPTLQITLAFNPTPYVPVKPDDESWRQRAESDREAYRQIYYQLVQTDMKVTIANSLEGSDSISAIEDAAKETLTNMVLAIYQYLGLLLTAKPSPYVFYLVQNEDETLDELATEYSTTPGNIRRINPSIPLDGQLKKGETITIPLVLIPADQVIETPVSDNNPNSLFALTTTLTLSRDFNLVDDNFKDEPSVIFSASMLGPNLQRNASSDNSNSITIQEFARKLQDAFPELKAASGSPQIGVQDDTSVEIWVARFNDSATGIQFSIPNAGNPFYFALLPLANHLLSRDKVKIYPYVTGTPIYDMNAVDAAFNGVDIEKLAQTCLAAIDTFLQADFAIPAWQVEQAMVQNGAGDDQILYPYQYIINAKQTLADNIVKHLSTVLEDGNIPDDDNIKNAAERLRQELLISLSNAYSIDTVLQFNVDVTSPYTDPDIIAPNLFGKVIDPNDTTQTDQKAYAFSTTRFSLQKSDSQAGQQSYLTILFNSKKENDLHLKGGNFPIELQYEINSMEHDIEKVTSIDGYQSSSWLTFILPFDSADTQLGNLKIPIPLRAYPTSPSLTAQNFESVKLDPVSGITESDKLQEAKKWNYVYTYDYLRAQQDTINTDIILNVPSGGMQARLFADEEEPDLFAALLQFSAAYPGIQRDFSLYLLDQSSPENAYTAMQSLAWLVKRVANAWGNWQEDMGLYTEALTAEANYKYQVLEDETEIDGQNALLITVTPQPGTDFTLPEIEISGFKIDTVVDESEIKSYAYYTGSDDDPQYLSFTEGQAITQRNVWYRGFNIINQENVWSGISVIRNKILVEGIPTNPDFIYTTPTIRFISVLTPLLDPDIVINIADYTSATGKQKLDVYLSNFLKALFVELAGETTSRQIKLGINYSYNIQEDVESLRAVIPVSITTPYDLPIPAGWQTGGCPANPDDITPDSAFVCQVSALIQKWFMLSRPVTTNARFDMTVSLFSGLSNTQLPVLTLGSLYLNEADIKWS